MKRLQRGLCSEGQQLQKTSGVVEVVDPAAAKLEVVDLPVLVELQRMGKAHQEDLQVPRETFRLQNLWISSDH